MKIVPMLGRLLLLGGLVFLGLYCYGLVMGVFSPRQDGRCTAMSRPGDYVVMRWQVLGEDPSNTPRSCANSTNQRERRGF